MNAVLERAERPGITHSRREFRAPVGGEMETEVCLPVRLVYERVPEGEVEILRLVPLAEGPEVEFTTLPAKEQRSLLTLAREHARASAAERRI